MGETKVCPQCELGIDISEFSTRANGYVFLRCKTCCNGAIRIQKECEYCGETFPSTDKSKKKYCKEECRVAARRNREIEDPRIKLRFQAYSRAKREEISCNFSIDDIHIPTICPVLETPISHDKNSHMADSNPIVDRKDLNAPYSKNNVFVVSFKAFKERVIGTTKCSFCGKPLDCTRSRRARGSESESFCDKKCNRDFHNQQNRGLSGGSNTDRYDLNLIPTTPIPRKQAVEKNLPFHFTSKPCKRKHVAARRVSNGMCLECESLKRAQKASEQNARYHANRTDINQRRNQVLRNDPKRRAIANLRSYRATLLRRLIDEGIDGVSKNSFDDDLGCTYEHYLNHLESTFVDGMTWDNYGEWHQDHVKSLSLFDDPLCPEAWHWTNFQALWASENIGKGGSNNPSTRALFDEEGLSDE